MGSIDIHGKTTSENTVSLSVLQSEGQYGLSLCYNVSKTPYLANSSSDINIILSHAFDIASGGESGCGVKTSLKSEHLN